jgi:signal transduction histidine kinase
MTAHHQLDLQATLDGLGQGILIFGDDGRLMSDNLAARTFLGTDIFHIREMGWEAAAALLNARQTDPDKMLDSYRQKAIQSERPVRFNTFRSGEYVPCWASAIVAQDGELCTMITIDAPDWAAMASLMETFRTELTDAINSTRGHIDIIEKDIQHFSKSERKNVDQLTKRITGLTRLVFIHMTRVGRLMEMLERMEQIRTGKLRDIIKANRKRILLEDFFEDFLEDLDQMPLVDPETDAHDHRSRVRVHVAGNVAVSAVNYHLTRILQDILRNAIMYSMKATPININVSVSDYAVQIDITDEGYGIREREQERVFEPFQRARQPQIFSEFGYGLSLYLCKYEVEAMNGRIWFESTEGVGTTLSLTLPTWRDSSSDSEPIQTV